MLWGKFFFLFITAHFGNVLHGSVSDHSPLFQKLIKTRQIIQGRVASKSDSSVLDGKPPPSTEPDCPNGDAAGA